MPDFVTADELFSLKDHVVIVTGAATGIGRTTAEVLASAGAHVIGASLASDGPEEAAAQARARGLSVEQVTCDVTDGAQLQAVVDHAISRYGRIDGVFANAGVSIEDHPNGMDRDRQFDLMFDINVRSILNLADLTIPYMAERGDGSFVIMSSLASIRGNAKIPIYGLTKAANAQLARNLAVQWGPSGIRVNSIAPGVITTDFAKAVTDGPGRDARIAKTPMRRFGEPYHVAGTVLWLMSRAGSFTSGQQIIVDGGTVISD